MINIIKLIKKLIYWIKFRHLINLAPEDYYRDGER